MADSDERKSMEAEHGSEDDEVSALLWTARRLEPSDDDDDDEEILDREMVKEKHRWSSFGLLDDKEGFEEMSQEEGERQETVHVNKGKEKKPENDDVFVPSHGSFYMHDDRFRRRRYGRRRGTRIGMKLWDCRDEQKWKHDKFEDMMDRSAPQSYHQRQRKNRSKGHSYAYRNQFGSHDNFGNQNKTSRIVRGRGPVKYKPLVKRNNINPSSKHQIPAKLKESTSSSSFPGVSSFAFAFPSDSSVETPPQTTNFEHDLVGRGNGIVHGAARASFQPGSSLLSLLPVMQLGGLPYGAVDDQAPSIALLGYTSQSQLGSRNCGVTSNMAGAAKPCNVNNPLADRSVPELAENEFWKRQLKPRRYSKMR